MTQPTASTTQMKRLFARLFRDAGTKQGSAVVGKALPLFKSHGRYGHGDGMNYWLTGAIATAGKKLLGSPIPEKSWFYLHVNGAVRAKGAPKPRLPVPKGSKVYARGSETLDDEGKAVVVDFVAYLPVSTAGKKNPRRKALVGKSRLKDQLTALGAWDPPWDELGLAELRSALRDLQKKLLEQDAYHTKAGGQFDHKKLLGYLNDTFPPTAAMKRDALTYAKNRLEVETAMAALKKLKKRAGGLKGLPTKRGRRNPKREPDAAKLARLMHKLAWSGKVSVPKSLADDLFYGVETFADRRDIKRQNRARDVQMTLSDAGRRKLYAGLSDGIANPAPGDPVVITRELAKRKKRGAEKAADRKAKAQALKRADFAPLKRTFEELRGIAEEKYPEAASTGLVISSGVHDSPRHFGRASLSKDGPLVELAPELVDRPPSEHRGIIAHEFGHVLVLVGAVVPVKGSYDAVERQADRIAEEVFGQKIFYKSNPPVQCMGRGARGRRPRPRGLR